MIWQSPGVNIAEPLILAQNKLAGGTIGLSSATAAGNPLNVLTETTYDDWRAGILGGAIYARTPGPVPINAVALVGHNIATIGGTLLFGYRVEIGAEILYFTPPITPLDNGPIVLLTPVTWVKEVLFTVYTGATAGVVVSNFWAGDRLVLPTSVAPDYVRAADAVGIEGEAAISRGGQYLGGTIRKKAGRLSPSLNPVARGWADNNLPAFRDHYDKRRPFIFASSPAVYPGDVVYGWRGDNAGELRPALRAGGRFVQFGMELDFHVA